MNPLLSYLEQDSKLNWSDHRPINYELTTKKNIRKTLYSQDINITQMVINCGTQQKHIWFKTSCLH